MTFNKVITAPASLPANLLSEAKTALYITDESFNDKISLLCFDAIYDFERITSTSVLPQTITVIYQYFKGRNKLPFGPHVAITPIADFTIDGSYLEGGTGEKQTVVFTAGYTTVPANIRRTLVKMVECMFRDEAYKPSLYSEIRSYSSWMD
jgi:hypothetical protein